MRSEISSIILSSDGGRGTGLSLHTVMPSNKDSKTSKYKRLNFIVFLLVYAIEGAW
jgi:hypothetical protein